MCVLCALAFTAGIDADFRNKLLQYAPGAVVIFLLVKIVLSAAAFSQGIRRKVISGQAAALIICGWILSGLFLAGYAGLVCIAVNQQHYWVWIAAGGFVVLPLADLAIAPLALAWNRHR
jgi:hypothetical protein